MTEEEILQKLPISVYISKYKITDKTFEIIEFNMLSNAGFSGFSKEEFTPEMLLGSFDKDEIKNFIQIAKNLSKNDNFNLKYHFKAKDGRILYFKDYLKVLDIKDNIYTFLGTVTNISEEAQFSQIFETLLKSPIIGILIYKEKNILANDTLKNFFEIGDEIYNLNVIDLVPENIKPQIIENLKRRLKGEKLSNIKSAEFRTFKNRRLYLEFFADTIFYDGGYAGLAFVINKTKFYKNKNLLSMLAVVSALRVSINDEKYLLKEIKDKLKEINYFADIKMNEKLDVKEIEVNNNLQKEKFKSYLYLPVIIDNKVVVSYSFYSSYKDDFDEEVIGVLKEIRKKIILAINDIKNKKSLIILNKAMDASYQWVVITNKQGIIFYANKAVEEISGYSKDEIIGKKPSIFKSGFHNREFFRNLWKMILRGEIFNDIIINRNKNGELFYLKIKIIPVTIKNKTYFVSLGIDITKEKLLEKEIHLIKFKDKLTNLLNREGFLLEGNKRLKSNKKFALFIIDIKDFKLLNEIKGYKYCNLLLGEFAKFLNDVFYNEDLIARLSNDDFAVLMRYDDLKMLSSVINKFLEKIKQKQSNIQFDVNIGIALYPRDAKNLEKLIEKSYMALSFAKKMEENSYKIYNENISEEIKNYIEVKDLVNQAIENKKFIYYFQPYVDTNTLKFCGAESLLRIKTKDKIITPNIFIDYSEKSGIIKNIELLMMKNFINTIEKLKFPLSFNLSGISLRDEEHINKLIDISKDYAKFITIEITERELIEDLNHTEKIFAIFKNKGYKISIDDFGTGYSSLSYISNIPMDVLKIDISFIRNITNSKKDLIIVETIIDFAKKLNLKTVAEGVETKEQVEILKKLGCDYLQGYYFSKPVPFDEFKKLID